MFEMLKRMSEARADGFKAGTAETCCGPGSTLEYTKDLRLALADLLYRRDIKSMNDAGAGDRNWIRRIMYVDFDYRGFDLFPHEGVTILDITRQTMPPADLILCRDVLIHLPEELIHSALLHFKESAPLLLSTSYDRPEHDRLGEDYDNIKLDLSIEPFDLGEPLEKLKDGEAQWLGLWRLG